MPSLLGNGGRLDEEFVWFGLETLTRPGDIDHRVNNNVGHMHARGPKLARDGFGEYALRGLVGAKPAKEGLPRSADVFPVRCCRCRPGSWRARGDALDR